MRFTIVLLILIFSSLQALDYTIQTLFGATVYAQEENPETSLSGELMLYLLDDADLTADAALRLEDKGIYFNRARIKLIRNWWDLSLGRQQIGWGNGYNFNPTDIFNAKPLGAAFDPSYSKKGRDSAIFTLYAGDLFSFETIYAFRSVVEEELDNILISETTEWDLGGKFKTNLLDFDLAFTFSYSDFRTREIAAFELDQKLEPRKLAGISIAGSLPVIDFGIWLEGVYDIEEETYEFVTGTEYVFLEDYTLNIEYYRNSSGKKHKADYDLSRLYFNEMLAQDYLIPALRWLVHEKLEIAVFSFLNLNDKSASHAAVCDYYFNDYVDFIITPFYLTGENDSEFGRQTVDLGDYGLDLKVRLFI
jgi:hypothetical protein